MKIKHKAYIGITQSGKTYRALFDAKKSNNLIIYYNIKNQKIEHFNESDIIKITAKNSIGQLNYIMYSNNYKFINFIPAENQKHRDIELTVLTNIAMRYVKKITLIIDEAFEVIPQGKNESAIFTVARRGASENVELVLITQSAGDIDKKALKQCEEINIFKCNEWDYKYLKNIGFDGSSIKNKINNMLKYSYVKLVDGETLTFAG